MSAPDPSPATAAAALSPPDTPTAAAQMNVQNCWGLCYALTQFIPHGGGYEARNQRHLARSIGGAAAGATEI